MATLIAPCGLDCAKCEAYIATQANDQAALEKLVEKWRVEFNAPNLSVDNVLCDGCMGGGRVIGYCAECGIRKCAVDRGLENCAACSDYGCEKLTAFWANAPQAQANLEALRKID